MKRLLVVLVVLALVPLSLAACGGDDDDDGGEEAATTTEEATGGGGGGGGGGGEATTLKLSADPDGAIAYDTDSLEAPAGDVTIDFDNPASLAHDVCLESPAGDEVGCSDTVTDDSTSLDAKVESGDYTFFCSVDGHRDQGMEGTLTVQ